MPDDSIGEPRVERDPAIEPDSTLGNVARRQVVLHPRTASARRVDLVRATSSRVRGFATDADDVLGYVFEQRRLACTTFVPVIVAVALVLAMTATTDVLHDRTIGGVPVLWLLLGPITLGAILVAAAWHERRALRLEDRWASDREAHQ